jgi:hypothetical protein
MLTVTDIKRSTEYLQKNTGLKKDQLEFLGKTKAVVNGQLRHCDDIRLRIHDQAIFDTITKNLSGQGSLENGFPTFKHSPVPGYEFIIILDSDGDYPEIEIPESKIEIQEKIDKVRMHYRGCEDLARLRMSSGQRVVACFKKKAGISSGESEKEIEKLIKEIESSYTRLTDGVVRMTEKRLKEANNTTPGIIDTMTEFYVVETYMGILKQEEASIGRLKKMLEGIPIYDEFLSWVKGCGPKMAGAILSELDIYAAPYPSSFWRYCGLDVVKDPETGEKVGRRNWRRLMEKTTCVSSSGEFEETLSLGYNPKIKSKLTFVLGSCLMKANGYYKTEAFDPYRERLEHRPDLNGQNSRKMAMARRYMVKQFLVDLHVYWKKLEQGIDVKPYQEEKLGKRHSRKTFLECLNEAKQFGGKPEDYIGQIKATA